MARQEDTVQEATIRSSRPDSMEFGLVEKRSPVLIQNQLSPSKSLRAAISHNDVDTELEGHLLAQAGTVLDAPRQMSSKQQADATHCVQPVSDTNIKLTSTMDKQCSSRNRDSTAEPSGDVSHGSLQPSISSHSRQRPTVNASIHSETPAVPAPSIVELPATPLEALTPAHIPEDLGQTSFFDSASSDDESYGPEIARTGTRTPERPKLVDTQSSSSGLRQLSPIKSDRLSSSTRQASTRKKAAKVLGIEGDLEDHPLLPPGIGGKAPPRQARLETESSDAAQVRGAHSNDNEGAPVATATLTFPASLRTNSYIGTSLPSTAVTSASSLVSKPDSLKIQGSRESASPFTPSSVIEVPDTPLRIAGLDTLPSPMGGFGTLRGPSPNASPRVVDGLRSNPPDALSPATTSKPGQLQRTLSAPPLPFRAAVCSADIYDSSSQLLNSKLRNRKVAIQGIDVANANELRGMENSKRRSGQYVSSMVREYVVSTPYPNRDAHSLNTGNVQKDDPVGGGTSGEKTDNSHWNQNPQMNDTRPDRITNEFGRDQDISASLRASTHPEVIKVELLIAGYPLKRRLIKIHVEDKAIFDDEKFFVQLRKEYGLLLGRAISLLTARHVRAIHTHTNGTTSTAIEEVEFLRHYQNPSLGRRRKTFLSFLRFHQRLPARKPLLDDKHSVRNTSEGMGDDVSAFGQLFGSDIAEGNTAENTEDANPQNRLSDVKLAAKSTFGDPVPQREWFDMRTSERASDISKDVTPGRSLLESRKVGNTSGTFRDNASESPLFGTRTVQAAPETLRNVIPGRRVFDADTVVGNTFKRPPGDPAKHLFHIRTIGRKIEEPDNSCAISDPIDDCPANGRNCLRNRVVLEFSHAYSHRRILLVSSLVLFLSSVVSVLWIVFGKPGHGPQDDGNGNWRQDAGERIITGLVFGIVMLLIGGMLEALWLWLSSMVL